MKKRPTYCNKCGRKLDVVDQNAGLKFVLYPGYGSKYDLCAVTVELCCGCFDKFIDSCKINPAKGYLDESN